MKNTIFIIKIIAFNFLLFISCKDQPLEFIDPTEDINAFSRSLLINGSNIVGNPDFSKNSTDLRITSYQNRASISGDNFLFIPFSFSNNIQFNQFYFYLEDADNYWTIKVDSLNINKNNYVLKIGIPENVGEGEVTILYGLMDEEGITSEPTALQTIITLPEIYCDKDGAPKLVEGNDGITVKTYNLGSSPGWITFEYNTLVEPDRIDVRYNKQWIRSTGTMLNETQDTPPTGDCEDVTIDEGFIGTNGYKQFTFFYKPSISDKLDIYVSGCLNGTTIWRYKLYCPTDKSVLGLFSSAAPDDPNPCAGHSWVLFYNSSTKKTHSYGLWPDNNHKINEAGLNNGSGSDVRIDFLGDSYISDYSRFYPLSNFQVNDLNSFVSKYKKYSIPNYVCTSYAQELIYEVTGEFVESGDFYEGLNIETPRAMSNTILNLELKQPTTDFFNSWGFPNGNTNYVACGK